MDSLYAMNVFLFDLLHELIDSHFSLAKHYDAWVSIRALDLLEQLYKFHILFLLLDYENFLPDFRVGTDFRIPNLDSDWS